MPLYKYRATDAAGDEVNDSVEATGVADAATRIEALGLTVLSITLAKQQTNGLPQPQPQPVSVGTALAEAARRLLAVKDDLVEPLRAYAKESARGRRKHELNQIANILAAGDDAAVLSSVEAAPASWGTLLAAAAASADGEGVFRRFVDRERPVATLRRRRRIASFYPLAVVLICLAILWPVASFVLPMFKSLFDSFGLVLPGITLLVLAIGEFLSRGGVYLLGAAIAFGVILWMSLNRWMPEVLAPVAHRLTRFWRGGSLGAARLTTHTADLIEARLPTDEAIRLADEHVYGSRSNRAADLALKLTINPLRDDLAKRPGNSLDFALATPMSDAARVRVLRELSSCHNERSALAASWAEGVVGPFTIMLLGILVGGVVLALYLPLVSLIEALT